MAFFDRGLGCSPGRTAAAILTASLVAIALGAGLTQAANAVEDRISVVKTPGGGVQPQAVLDGRGTLHLLYFRGEPDAGDLYYSRRKSGETGYSAPLTVNSQRGTAVATGANRGGQLAVGSDGRAHVVWFGSEKATPQASGGGAPLLYARLNDAGTAFEAQRDLLGKTFGLDGGPSVSADESGNVYVVWHAGLADDAGDEARRPWVAVSHDQGKSFAPAALPFISETGACSGCQTKAGVDREGKAYFLYRTSTGRVNRDMALGLSGGPGTRFEGKLVDRWRTEPDEACPKSSAALTDGPDGMVAAWETRDHVFWGRIEPKSGKVEQRIGTPVFVEKVQKHPALAVNAAGETLLAWVEGPSGQPGGDLVWQLFGRTGQPVGQLGRRAGVLPPWGRSTAAARADGGFQIWY